MHIGLCPANSVTAIYSGVCFSLVDVFETTVVFYESVRADSDLCLFYLSVGNWEELRVRSTHFWWKKLGGNTFITDKAVNFDAKILPKLNDAQVSRWLMLFKKSMEKLNPEQRDLWSELVEKKVRGFLFKKELELNGNFKIHAVDLKKSSFAI